MSAPQPGLVGMIKWPFSILGGSVMEIAQQNLAFFYPRPDNGFGSPAGTFTKPVFRIMVNPTTTTQMAT
jgi:hypothetical protein